MKTKPTLTKALLSAAALSAVIATGAQAKDAPYFDDYKSLKLERSDSGVLVATLNTDGGPIKFTAKDHNEFVEAFYRIGQDRDNKVVILTGQGDWMAQIDFSTFGNVGDADTWSAVHDEGVQIMENLINIRVPVIAAIEGKAHIHSEYALTANVVVAGKSASFSDLPHFAGGIVPGDGIFTTWSYRAGPGRAEAWLLNPQPISADTAYGWGW
jgi:enoyl-CoA hydratase/carnithine racemase